MKLEDGDRRTEFACMCCMEKRWRKHPGQAWICPYRAKDQYCSVISDIFVREANPATSWEEIGRRLAKERKNNDKK